MKIRANQLDLEVEDSGPGAPGENRPVVLLIMGLGMQLTAWPPALVQALVDAGFRVIRHDNRDVGLSTHLAHLGRPHMLWAMLKMKLGFKLRAPYSLADMANDALAVLQALGVDKAHIVGASMGGMIAQRLALAAPERTLSLTSVMSSSGAKGLPAAKPEVLRVLMRRPQSQQLDAVVAHYETLFKTIGSPAFETPAADLRERIVASAQRNYDPVGTQRQMLAILSDRGRATQLERLHVPTLVIHGKADPLVPFACGEDTARRIAGAQLMGIEGMGHDLPPAVVAYFLPSLIAHLKSASAVHT